MTVEILFNYSKVTQTAVTHPTSTKNGQAKHMQHHSLDAANTLHKQGVSESDYLHIKEQTWYLIGRAYQNIYGLSMPADPQYQQVIFNAAIQLRMDERASRMGERDLLHAFEDIIRISDEHYREAQQHLSRASNPVYLRETALDKALEHQKYLSALEELMPKSKVAGGMRVQHSGRVYRAVSSTHGTEDMSHFQLALSLSAS